MSRLRFFAERRDYANCIALHIGHEDGDTGKVTSEACPLTMAPRAELDAYAEPCLRLRPDEACALMDELWQAGIRPTNGVGSVGQLAATERHLADMRALALKPLGLNV